MNRQDFMNHMFEMDPIEMPEPAPKVDLDIEAYKLLDAYNSYNTRHDFKPGMFVRQKSACRGYSTLGQNDIGIVISVFKEHPIIRDDATSTTPHYREVLDMVVASLEDNGDFAAFCHFHVDSRRFEPIPESETAAIIKMKEAA